MRRTRHRAYRNFQRSATPAGDLSEALWADPDPGPDEHAERVDEVAHARERVGLRAPLALWHRRRNACQHGRSSETERTADLLPCHVALPGDALGVDPE